MLLVHLLGCTPATVMVLLLALAFGYIEFNLSGTSIAQSTASGVSTLTATTAPEAWTASHSAEQTFQKEIAMSRLIKAPIYVIRDLSVCISACSVDRHVIPYL